MRIGVSLPPTLQRGPWQTSPCQSAPGRSACQRRRVFVPPSPRLARRGRPAAAKRRLTVGSETLDLSKQPSSVERVEDERHRRARVLAPDVEQQLAKLLGEVLCEAAITAGLRAKPSEATSAIRVEPALQRRHRVGARAGRARRPIARLAQDAQLVRQLPMREIAEHDGAKYRRAKDRDLLGAIARLQIGGMHF